jgi:hypothetical protein
MKTCLKTIKKIHVKKKVVPIYACPEVGERCPVNVLDKYISKLPPHALEHDIFYLRPLQAVPADPNAPWYAPVPVGRDTLQKKIHLMCEQAGIKAACICWEYEDCTDADSIEDTALCCSMFVRSYTRRASNERWPVRS